MTTNLDEAVQKSLVGHHVMMVAWHEFSKIRDLQNAFLAEWIDAHIIVATCKDEAMCCMIMQVDAFQWMKRESPADWC